MNLAMYVEAKKEFVRKCTIPVRITFLCDYYIAKRENYGYYEVNTERYLLQQPDGIHLTFLL